MAQTVPFGSVFMHCGVHALDAIAGEAFFLEAFLRRRSGNQVPVNFCNEGSACAFSA
jgi:hypothetical protein